MESISSELVEEVLDFIKDAVRTRPLIPFHLDQIYAPLPSRFRERPEGKEILRAQFAAAISKAETECPGLKVVLRDSFWGIDLSVSGDAEWSDALRFAHGTEEGDASRIVSSPATQLLARIESGELADDFRSELSVRHRIQYFGYGAPFSALIEEIRVKRGFQISMEEKGERYPQKKHLLKFKVVSRRDPTERAPALNPVLGHGGDDFPSRREFQRWFFRLLADSPFQGNETILIWCIDSRKEFLRCFPGFSKVGHAESSELVHLFSSVRGNPTFQIAWDFAYNSGIWKVEAMPARTWEETRTELRAALDKQTTEAQYKLSPAASELFDWLRSLSKESFEFGLSPPILRENRDAPPHLDCPWSSDNFRLYLELLCEEVSEHTPLSLRLVDWRQSGTIVSRILVRPRDPSQPASNTAISG